MAAQPAGLIPEDWQTEIYPQAQTQTEQLLQLFDQPTLTKLIEDTLAANYDLQQTAIRLKQQTRLITQANAARRPQINLNLNSQRQKEESINNQHQIGLNLSWELDLWGRLADNSDAEQANLLALEAEFQAARNSLAARVVQSWIAISMRDQIILAQRAWVSSLQKTESVITERYSRGLGALADLEVARAATARARAQLAATKQEQHQAYHQLALLRGVSTTDQLLQPSKLPEVAPVAAVLPIEAISRRHDIQAAYRAVVSADASASAAYKQLLPSFEISTDLSQSNNTLSDLLSGSAAWQLLGQLTAPLFNGGRLRAAADIAQLESEKRYLAYQQTLLTAIHEVETALGQESSLAIQEQQVRIALQHSKNSLIHYQDRYSNGLSDILDLLSAKQSAFDAQIQLFQIRQSRLINRIELGLALGMGV